MIPPRLSPKAMRLRRELLAKLAPLRKKPTPARDWAEFVRQRNSKAGKARWANVPRDGNGKRDHMTKKQRHLVARLGGMAKMASMTQSERRRLAMKAVAARLTSQSKKRINSGKPT